MDYKRVLVFGAHPDDELLMAPAMARMAAEGTAVVVAILTDGSEGFPDPSMRDHIAATRAEESEAARRVLGVERYVNLGAPDMGLVNSKEMLRQVIALIREVRPEAIFTQGEKDRHRDHLATNALTVEASWHAGEPVSTDLGELWRTPHLYYYKNTALDGPVVEYDATAYAHKAPEVYATQVSQLVLLNRSQESYLEEAARVKANPPKTILRFTLHPWTVLSDFPPLCQGRT
ncbi:MAG: PIG-L deacetylase family protein [Planctomycetota bacterium]|jgi:LmbE family N-acetylglucosaminyl deacetylase